MLYQTKDLLPYAHGCVGVYEWEGKEGFSRFAPSQIAYYESKDPDDALRTRSSSGIYLEFITGQKEISFCYRIVRYGYVQDGIDIRENGVLTAHFDPDLSGNEVKVSYERKCEEESVIRIYFPNGEICLPYDFSLGEIKPTAKKENLILFYGDSITHSAHTPNPSVNWFAKVADAFDAEYINRGVGCFYFDENSLPQKQDLDPDVVFIEYGQNDMCRFETTKEGLDAMERYIKRILPLYPKAQFVLITPDFVGPDGSNEKEKLVIRDYCENYIRIASNYPITVLEGNSLLTYDHENYCEDIVHLSEKGAAMFADNLICKLKDKLQLAVSDEQVFAAADDILMDNLAAFKELAK